MLYYRIDVLDALRSAGYSSYRLRRDRIFSEYTIQAFRENRVVGADVLDRLCSLLHLQPGDLIYYSSD